MRPRQSMPKKPRPEARKTFPPSFGGWKSGLKRQTSCPPWPNDRRLYAHRSAFYRFGLPNSPSFASSWSVVFSAHGSQKLQGWFGGPGLKETMRTMNEYLGLPIPLAFLAVTAECFGGLGLMVGLLSRVAA